MQGFRLYSDNHEDVGIWAFTVRGYDDNMKDKVFTSGEVAAICGVSADTVSRWFDLGQIEGYRLGPGGDRRIPYESLKKFINKLISKDPNLNKSKLIRDALLRLMTSPDFSNLDDTSSELLVPVSKNIIGNMMIVAPNDTNVQKKLNRIEKNYSDKIISKNQLFYPKNFSIFLVYEGSVKDLQRLVVEINSIKEII